MPSSGPSSVPSIGPSSIPSSFPSSIPSSFPSSIPSSFPSSLPSSGPSSIPSRCPSSIPSSGPSSLPSSGPSSVPSSGPSFQPTGRPSSEPTASPSVVPSFQPTAVPSGSPSCVPSPFPTLSLGGPLGITRRPSKIPSSFPSGEPSALPSSQPSMSVDSLIGELLGHAHLSTRNPRMMVDNSPFYVYDDSSTDTCASWNIFRSHLRLASSRYAAQWLSVAYLPSGTKAMESAHVYTCQNTTNVARILGSLGSGASSVSQECNGNIWRIHSCALGVILCIDNDCECAEKSITYDQEYSICKPILTETGTTFLAGVRTGYAMKASVPIISNVTVKVSSNRSRSTSLLIFVTFNESAEGSVFCKAYQPSQVPSSAAEIIIESVFTSIVGRPREIRIQYPSSKFNLATAYDVYCASVSAEGVMLDLSSVLRTKQSVVTPCCKYVDVALAAKHLVCPLASQLRSFITISLDSHPSEVVTIETTLLSVTGVALDIVVPSSLSFFKNDTRLSKSLTLLFDQDTPCLDEGLYTIEITLSGPSAIDYAPVSTLDFEISNASTPVAPPTLLHANFSSDGTAIHVVFDRASDRARLEFVEFLCTLLIQSPHMGDTLCFWKSNTEFTFFADNHITIGSELNIRSGVLRARCDGPIASCTSLYRTAESSSVTVGAPTLPSSPEVIINVANFLHPCSDIVIDLSSSSGSGGREWAERSWNVTIDGLGTSRSNLLLTFVKDTTNLDRVVIPSHLIDAGREYTFSAKRCSFFGMCSFVTKKLYVLDHGSMENVTLTVMIVGASSTRSISASQPLRLASVAHLASCGNETDISMSAYAGNGFLSRWTIVDEDGNTRVDLTSESSDPARFFLSPFKFTSGKTYTITTEVAIPERSIVSSASLVLFVRRDPLVLIASDLSFALRPGKRKAIDLSESYNPNLNGDKRLSDVHLTWSCSQLFPIAIDTCPGLRIDFFRNLSLFDLMPRSSDTVSRIYIDAVSVQGIGLSSTIVLDVKTLTNDEPVMRLERDSFFAGANTNRSLIFRASAMLDDAIQCQWSSSPLISNFDGNSTVTPTFLSFVNHGGVYPHTMVDVSLKLSENVLTPRTVYTFTLDCGYISRDGKSTIEMRVITNGSPKPGRFRVMPKSGRELVDTFLFEAKFWQDEDLPLTYVFGVVVDSSSQLDLCVASEDYHLFAKLTHVRDNLDISSSSELSIYVNVIDSLGSIASKFETVEVVSSNISNRLTDVERYVSDNFVNVFDGEQIRFSSDFTSTRNLRVALKVAMIAWNSLHGINEKERETVLMSIMHTLANVLAVFYSYLADLSYSELKDAIVSTIFLTRYHSELLPSTSAVLSQHISQLLSDINLLDDVIETSLIAKLSVTLDAIQVSARPARSVLDLVSSSGLYAEAVLENIVANEPPYVSHEVTMSSIAQPILSSNGSAFISIPSSSSETLHGRCVSADLRFIIAENQTDVLLATLSSIDMTSLSVDWDSRMANRSSSQSKTINFINNSMTMLQDRDNSIMSKVGTLGGPMSNLVVFHLASTSLEKTCIADLSPVNYSRYVEFSIPRIPYQQYNSTSSHFDLESSSFSKSCVPGEPSTTDIVSCYWRNYAVECDDESQHVPYTKTFSCAATITEELSCESMMSDQRHCIQKPSTDPQLITCLCDICEETDSSPGVTSKRRLGDKLRSSSGRSIAISAVATYVLNDATSIVTSADQILNKDVHDDTSIIRAMFIAILLTFVATFTMNEMRLKALVTKEKPYSLLDESLVNEGRRVIPCHDTFIEQLKDSSAEKAKAAALLAYIFSIMPPVFNLTLGKWERLKQQLTWTSPHLLLTLVFGETRFLRFVAAMELITFMSCMALVVASTVSVEMSSQEEVVALCASHNGDERSCMSESSSFTGCTWSVESNACNAALLSIEESLTLSCLVVIVSTIVAIPLRLICSFMFDTLIRSPCIDKHHNPVIQSAGQLECTATDPSSVFPFHGGRRRRAVTSAIEHDLIRTNQGIERVAIIPDTLVRSRDKVVALLSSEPALTGHENKTYSTVNLLGEVDGDLLMSNLKKSLSRFLPEALIAFDVDVYAAFLRQWRIVDLEEAFDHTLSFQWENREHLRKCLRKVAEDADQLHGELRKLPKNLHGVEMMRQLIIDVIGRNSVHGQVFDVQSREYLKITSPVHISAKVFAWSVVIMLNIGCFIMCVLYASKHGEEWQMLWIRIFAVYLVYLLVIDMSFESFVVGYALPYQTGSIMYNIQESLRHKLFDSIIRNRIKVKLTEESDTAAKPDSSSRNERVECLDVERLTSFSASHYLHVSHRLAQMLEHEGGNVYEARMILGMTDPFPRASYPSSSAQSDTSRTSSTPYAVMSILAYLSSSLLYMASWPLILQRFVIALPLPLIGMFVSNFVLAFSSGRTAIYALSLFIFILSCTVVVCIYKVLKESRERKAELLDVDSVFEEFLADDHQDALRILQRYMRLMMSDGSDAPEKRECLSKSSSLRLVLDDRHVARQPSIRLFETNLSGSDSEDDDVICLSDSSQRSQDHLSKIKILQKRQTNIRRTMLPRNLEFPQGSHELNIMYSNADVEERLRRESMANRRMNQKHRLQLRLANRRLDSASVAVVSEENDARAGFRKDASALRYEQMKELVRANNRIEMTQQVDRLNARRRNRERLEARRHHASQQLWLASSSSDSSSPSVSDVKRASDSHNVITSDVDRISSQAFRRLRRLSVHANSSLSHDDIYASSDSSASSIVSTPRETVLKPQRSSADSSAPTVRRIKQRISTFEYDVSSDDSSISDNKSSSSSSSSDNNGKDSPTVETRLPMRSMGESIVESRPIKHNLAPKESARRRHAKKTPYRKRKTPRRRRK